MGRGLLTPNDSLYTIYDTFDSAENNYDVFDFYVDDWKEVLKSMFPSLEDNYSKDWLNKETGVILENNLVYVGITEYCSMVGIVFVPVSDSYGDYIHYGISEHWIHQITPKLNKLSNIKRVGSFSNGEQIFERVVN